MDARGTEAPKTSLGSLIVSDYLAICRGRPESRARRALMFLPRLLYHAPLHATTMIRLAQRGPSWMHGLWRTLLVWKHAIDVNFPVEVGPGLLLPHPVSIVIGQGTKIGANVQIMNLVTVGARPYARAKDGRLCPEIGDGAILLTQSIVVGPITVGENALIGARTWVDKDVPSGAMVRGEQTTVIGERRMEPALPDLG
jgi:serine O-acetyltransferase